MDWTSLRSPYENMEGGDMLCDYIQCCLVLLISFASSTLLMNPTLILLRYSVTTPCSPHLYSLRLRLPSAKSSLLPPSSFLLPPPALQLTSSHLCSSGPCHYPVGPNDPGPTGRPGDKSKGMDMCHFFYYHS
eukprot:760726-Hanusia_phi.AAC.4